ncbi:hypothetical protein MKX01_003978 [Papaver californicum]|nr:hypothetical protein MKX01_003978 [Papaver californicum]
MASISTCFTLTVKNHHHHQHKNFPLKPLILGHSSKRLEFKESSFFQTSSIKLSRNVAERRVTRVSVVPGVIRANIDFPLGISRPGNSIETDKLPTDVRKRAMDAVDSFGGRVTVGDVSSKSGLQLAEAEKALQALASDTSGFLEVSDEGDVLYVFPRDYRTKLVAKSFRLKIEPWLEKGKSAAEYVVRVTFGTALIASIVIVYTSIIVLLSSRSDEDNRGRRQNRSFNPGFGSFFRPSDLFWYWDPYYYRRRQPRTDNNEMNFVESIFSFVFGDGDPNQGLEEQRWKLIGQYIASNGGVVTAEELAPYLDVPPLEKSENDESYILPVLLKFDGYPDVDEEGSILYRFPTLQKTASSGRSKRKENVGKSWNEFVGGVQKVFKEKNWPFSNSGGTQKAMAIGLGALNLFGVIVLGTLLKDATVASKSSEIVSFVSGIFPLLQVYAGTFFAIPLVRWFILRRKNAEIDKRNLAREQRARILDSPDVSLRRKLLSARDMAKQTVIGRDRIVYSTEKDLNGQDYEAKEWDRRFKEIDRRD